MAIRTELIGRFGNQMFQYARARSEAERTGQPLSTPRWVGEQIFELPETVPASGGDMVIQGYCQDQVSLIYSKKDCLRWFKWRPEILEKLQQIQQQPVVAHRRTGDYASCGYVVVSDESYFEAVKEFKIDHRPWLLTEEKPSTCGGIPPELSFLPDFWLMVNSKYLLRGNSTFSYWASVLGNADTFCPNIDNLPGGFDQFCHFEHGNHKKFANLECCTDLHMFRVEDRIDYDLNENSIVVDGGGYHGLFTQDIHSKYKCFVDVYEPEAAAFDILRERFSGNQKIQLNKRGIAGTDRKATFLWKGDMTGEFADQGEGQSVQMVSINSIVESRQTVDLLKLNIEGGEFEVLESLIEAGNHRNCRHIQVQFHTCVDNYRNRYYKIREALRETHQVTFDIPFQWQSWSRK